jgi:hypothetical protein
MCFGIGTTTQWARILDFDLHFFPRLFRFSSSHSYIGITFVHSELLHITKRQLELKKESLKPPEYAVRILSLWWYFYYFNYSILVIYSIPSHSISFHFCSFHFISFLFISFLFMLSHSQSQCESSVRCGRSGRASSQPVHADGRWKAEECPGSCDGYAESVVV